MKTIEQVIKTGMVNKNIRSVTKLSALLGYKESTFRYKIRESAFTQSELSRLFQYLDTPNEDIVSLYK